MLKVKDNPRFSTRDSTIILDGQLPSTFMVVINGVIQHPEDYDWVYNSKDNITTIQLRSNIEPKAKIQIIWV